jgi:hypothetical protein
MAVVAISMSRSTIREGKALRATKKREAYFTRYITERAIAAVDSFTASAIAAVNDCVTELDHCDSDPNYDVFGATAAAAEKFQDAQIRLKGQLLSITESWPDSELWSGLQTLLYNLEDFALNRIDKLVARTARHEGLDDLLRSHAAGLLRFLLEYDETQHQIGKK